MGQLRPGSIAEDEINPNSTNDNLPDSGIIV